MSIIMYTDGICIDVRVALVLMVAWALTTTPCNNPLHICWGSLAADKQHTELASKA